jgi:hypothetical protein
MKRCRYDSELKGEVDEKGGRGGEAEPEGDDCDGAEDAACALPSGC